MTTDTTNTIQNNLVSCVVYTDIDKDWKPIIKCIRIEDATRVQLSNAKRLGIRYESDGDALHDFCVVHWATIENIPLQDLRVLHKGSDMDCNVYTVDADYFNRK